MNLLQQHDIFLSHSTRRNIVAARESIRGVYRSLTIGGYRVFLDYSTPTAEGGALTVLEAELRASRAAVVFWDECALGSVWVGIEMSILRERRHTREMKACIVLRELGLKPPPGFDKWEILPYLQWELPHQLSDRICACFGNWLTPVQAGASSKHSRAKSRTPGNREAAQAQ